MNSRSEPDINNKDIIKALPYYITITFLVVFLATIFSRKELEANYSLWVGLLLAASSLMLAITFSRTQSKESKELIKSINNLKISIEELKRSHESTQKNQSERLNNIEKELKIYQEKLSSTNLLSIFINRKKWE